jgi:hypothetical protein
MHLAPGQDRKKLKLQVLALSFRGTYDALMMRRG